MKKINLVETGFKELTSLETITIVGGHDGVAYYLGKSIHTAIITVGEFAKGVLGALILKK